MCSKVRSALEINELQGREGERDVEREGAREGGVERGGERGRGKRDGVASPKGLVPFATVLCSLPSCKNIGETGRERRRGTRRRNSKGVEKVFQYPKAWTQLFSSYPSYTFLLSFFISFTSSHPMLPFTLNPFFSGSIAILFLFLPLFVF